ncbi:MAG: hypothetical protein IPJ65_05800 [Archangiaceae bacterium]|nr:hypothetical protein [Archangiaceae bacterium]
MVSDLRATLDTMGRLDVLTGISDRVDRYLAATADGRDPGTRRALARSLELRSAALRATSDRKQAGELTARALALLDQADTEEHSVSTTEVRASLLTAQALDAAAGGDFELARLKHRAAASAWSSLIGKPGQPLAAANAARALASVGETADRLGDRLEAELAWRQASATLDTARTAATPSEANEVASAEALVRFSMGKALRRSGELAASERELTAALDVLAPALAQPHAAYEPRRVAIMTLQLLADTKIARGIDDVHPLHVRAHALATASVAAEPSNRQMRKQLAQAWRELARDADLQGDPLRAIANLELALAEYERLIALGDDDVLLRRNTAIVSSELGDTLAPRDVKKARAAVAKAVELFLGLARAGDARTQLDVVFALRQASALERRAGQPAAAWAHAEKALAVLDLPPPLADEPPVATFYRAAGLAEAAAVERQLGRTAGAKAHRAAALGLVAALERSGKLQAGWLEEIEGARKR